MIVQRLSKAYEHEYASMLDQIRALTHVHDAELTMFWPKIGTQYVGELLIVGRAVNGWIDRWVPGEGSDPWELTGIARKSAEGQVNGDQMGWVLDRWKRRDGEYDTSTSQFWETTRRVIAALIPDEPNWPSRVAWTNLLKVAPWRGGNPGSHLLALERRIGPALLARELDELQPRFVVAFTGRWWFEPFAEALKLDIAWQTGLVEGIANEGPRTWVIAVHPMTRSPRAVADAVVAALITPVGCETQTVQRLE